VNSNPGGTFVLARSKRDGDARRHAEPEELVHKRGDPLPLKEVLVDGLTDRQKQQTFRIGSPEHCAVDLILPECLFEFPEDRRPQKTLDFDHNPPPGALVVNVGDIIVAQWRQDIDDFSIEGSLVSVDPSSGSARTLMTSEGLDPTFFHSPFVEADGNIVFTQKSQGVSSVRRFDTQDRTLSTVYSVNDSPGEAIRFNGLAVAPSGDIIVAQWHEDIDFSIEGSLVRRCKKIT
jgi:hypothetical protein